MKQDDISVAVWDTDTNVILLLRTHTTLVCQTTLSGDILSKETVLLKIY